MLPRGARPIVPPTIQPGGNTMSLVQRPPTSLAGAATHSASRPQVAPQRRHHLAYVTRDTEATADSTPAYWAAAGQRRGRRSRAFDQGGRPTSTASSAWPPARPSLSSNRQACRHRQPKRMPATAPSSTWRWRYRLVKTSTPGVPGSSPAGSRLSQSITAASTASISAIR